jgi:hypothetical protein
LSRGCAISRICQTELTKYLVPSGGYVFISEEGVKNVFANELSPKQQALVYATQTPAAHTIFDDKSGQPAWKQKPTWYVVAKNDKTHIPIWKVLWRKE